MRENFIHEPCSPTTNTICAITLKRVNKETLAKVSSKAITTHNVIMEFVN